MSSRCTDGYQLPDALAGQGVPAGGAALPTVAVLRRVRARHFEQDENRPGRGVPPNVRLQSVEGRGPGDRIESPYDAEARYRSKSNMNWTGSMVHLTETCDAGAPHLLQADTTPGNVHAMRVEAIHAALATKGPVPSEHLVDSAYTSADHLIRAREQHGIDLVGPGRSPTGWQARTKGAFGTSDFAIDWEGEVARCPEGRTSTSWRGYHDKATGPYVRARFSAANCNPCPSKARCTRGRDQGRQLTLPAREQHEALAAARTRHKTEAGRALCAQRQGISVGASLNMYWTPAQLLTHHASNGCNLSPGDLLGTGTISAPTPGGYGSLLEITGGGKEPVRLPSGESRRFLENGDEVILRARARRNGCAPIGFGECRGIVLPAFSDFCPPLSKRSKTGKADHLLADSASERGHGHTAQRGPAKAAVAGPTATSSCAAM